MVLVGKTPKDEPNVFYDCQEEFYVWEVVFLCVVFFQILLLAFYLLLQVFKIYTNFNC
jgi:hypothetical protein